MTASWVIREKATGTVIAETFSRLFVNALNTDRYEAVPIRSYLSSLNMKIKADGDHREPIQSSVTQVLQ